jgi:hypothetical protein
VLARSGQKAQAQSELARLVGPPPAPAPVIASARQLLADEAFRRRDYAEAGRIYRELALQPNERDALRMLQVKALALEGSPRARELLFALLVGEPGQAVDGATAVYLARELRAERADGLAPYLEARQLYARERYQAAAELLTRALALGLPTREIETEAVRLAAISRYATGELASSQQLWQRQQASAQEQGLRIEAADWLERIADAESATSRRHP